MPYYEERILQNNKVEVLFSTDKNGKLNFVFAKTADKSLKTEIEKQFSKVQLTKQNKDVLHSVNWILNRESSPDLELRWRY